MPFVRLTVSLDRDVAEQLERRALELDTTPSRYLAELIEVDHRRRQDALASEGYRLLATDTRRFAAAAANLAGETWPEWAEEGRRGPIVP
jgi:hypothetical protein